MGEEILTFGDIEIEKNKFYCHKTPTARKIIFSIFSARENIVYSYLFSIQEKMIFS